MDYTELPLEKVLEYCSLRSIETVHRGSGWVGTRYNVHLDGHGESGPIETMEGVRQYILKKEGYWIQHLHRCKTDPVYAESQRRWD